MRKLAGRDSCICILPDLLVSKMLVADYSYSFAKNDLYTLTNCLLGKEGFYTIGSVRGVVISLEDVAMPKPVCYCSLNHF